MSTTPLANSAIVNRLRVSEITFDTPTAINSTPMKNITEPK